jgi:outer membrane protein TolC
MISSLLLAAGLHGAFQAEAPLLTPQAAQELAARQNLSLQGQVLQHDLTSEQVDASRGVLLPSLALASTLTRVGPNFADDPHTNNPATTAGPDLQMNNALQLQMPLLNLGQWYQWRALQGQEKAAKSHVQGQAILLAWQIDQAYYTAVLQEQTHRTQVQTLELSRLREQIADKGHAIGVSSLLDLREAQLAEHTDSSTLLSLDATVIQARRNLNTLLSRDPETPFSVIDSIPVNDPGTLQQLHDQALANSPSLSELQAKLESQQAQVRSATANLFAPTLSAFANYQFVNRWHDQDPPPSASWQGFAFGLQLSYPIFGGGIQASQERQARIQERQIELSRRDSTLQLERGISQAWSNWESARKALALEEVNVKLADSTLTMAVDQYRVGAIAGIDLRTIQETDQQARIRWIEARYNARYAANQLRILAALPIDP